MPTIDVSEAIVCQEFSDWFEVEQRFEAITQYGRSQVTKPGRVRVLGVIFPTGDNSLQRQEDKQYGLKTLTVVTKYRLRTASPGAQPDMIYYRSNIFVVREVRDYSQFGSGFVEAVCSSVESIDAPPQ